MLFMPFMVKKNRLKAEGTAASFTCRHVEYVDKFEFEICFGFLISDFEFYDTRITDY